jgi:hypothetical protein
MESRLVLYNRTDMEITDKDMCGFYHQHLKYYKFRRIRSKRSKAIFYLFFHREEDTYAALRASKKLKTVSIARYIPSDPFDNELPFRPFPPDNIINICRYAFRKYLPQFVNVV